MVENFQAHIGATIRDFQRSMKEVDRQIRETALGADANIGADISDFMSEIGTVQAMMTELARDHEVNIDADIDDFLRDTAIVRGTISSFINNKIIIPVEARVNKFQQSISRIAQSTRAFGELTQTTFQGIGMSLSPTLVPLIATLGGLIGQIGPMIGTLAGSTFALGSAFATAGIGAAGFGAIAVTNLKDIFSASSELKKLQEELGKTDDLKARAKIMNEIKDLQGSLNAEQTKALSAMGKLKDTWTGIGKGLETKTIEIFTKSLDVFGGVLKTLEPMFISVTNSVDKLVESLGRSVNTKHMKEFFAYLNTSAGPMLEKIVKSFSNFAIGIASMMVAFGPLAESTSKGFLSMSASFATWAAGLGESKKFQAFVDYVNENIPKIRSIFSDAFLGILNTFAAFGPSSADMMTSLQSMMERFMEWSSTLTENQGFQNFINYIKENGPKVVSLIGSIVTTLVNLGKALAPMGSSLLNVVNGFLSMSSSLMENNPLLGKIIASVLMFTGVLIAIAPNLIAFGTLFGGTATAVMTATSLMRAKFVTGMGMMVTSMLATAKQMVITSAQFVAKWALIGAQSLIHAGKVAAAWALSTGKAMATALVSMLATSATFVAKWLWMGVQALAQAARMAAAWFIALGPVGWVIGVIVGLAILVIANWDKIKAATIKIWTAISNSVKDAWEKVKSKTLEAVVVLGKNIAKMPGKVREFVGDMVSAGASLIDGVIKGITGKIGEGLSAIGGFAKGLLARFKSDTDTHSPSRAFEDISKWFAPGIVRGIDKTSHLAINSVADMASRLTSAFSPQLDMPMIDLQKNHLDTHSQINSLKSQIKEELSVDMEVNHKGKSGIGIENGGGGYGPVYVTIDAKNVKEFNDVVRIFDQQAWDSN